MSVPIIFLSHSSRDAAIARPLKELLANHTKGAIDWWLSSDGQSIRGGKNWRSEVERALRDCRLVFILLTASSMTSAWVQYEAGFADALGKDIVPIALPGFDLDNLPGPLKHKQGFNIRGTSGLNNMLAITNDLLDRHDLLSLGDEDYNQVFSSALDVHAASVDAHFDRFELSLHPIDSLSKILAQSLETALKNEVTVDLGDKTNVLAGPGFVLREIVEKKSEEAPTTYELRGDLVGGALLDLLALLSGADVAALLPKRGMLECKLRVGLAIETVQPRLLDRLRHTGTRFVDRQRIRFHEVTMMTRARDANASQSVFIRSFGETSPQPYRPADMRYSIGLEWASGFPGSTLNDLLRLLIERQAIFPKSPAEEP